MGIENEYSEKMRKKPKSKLQPFLPAIGLILIGFFGFVAYMVSAPLHEMLRERLTTDIVQQPEMRYIIAFGIFLILVLILAAIYAAVFAPKRAKEVSEKELEDEKRRREREKLAAKKRKRRQRAKMAEELRRKNKLNQ